MPAQTSAIISLHVAFIGHVFHHMPSTDDAPNNSLTASIDSSAINSIVNGFIMTPELRPVLQ